MNQTRHDKVRLNAAASDLVAQLQACGRSVVFAESCTAGLIAATLAQIPGVSDHLCGSAVVYRNATKTAWLKVSAADLANPTIGAVSESVAEAMAIGVLQQTPEADLAAAVTGHLGPNAPAEYDGVVFVGVAKRDHHGHPQRVEVRRQVLTATDRVTRQQEAAAVVLEIVTTILSENQSANSSSPRSRNSP